MNILIIINKRLDVDTALNEMVNTYIRVPKVKETMKGADVYISYDNKVVAVAKVLDIINLITSDYVERTDQILPIGSYILISNPKRVEYDNVGLKVDFKIKYKGKITRRRVGDV